ncbi:MAG: glycosyltransferase family 4 protein [Alphaproteobacteria bacterium]|nr:glycosyltransferase family 4 protein [Alphaproteobacteria bacterium]
MLRDLARGFARDGWQVSVITTGPKAEDEQDGLVRVIRLKAAPRPAGTFLYFWIWLRMLFAALRVARTDVVVSMTDPPLLAVIGRIVSLVKKNRHIHWCQDLYPDVLPALGVRTPGFVMKALYGLSRNAMKNADKVIVVGRCMAAHLEQEGFAAGQISIIPNWPDSELSFPQNREGFNEASLRDGDAYDEVLNGHRTHDEQVKHGPKFRVLYAGNVGRAHPVETIMNAAEILNSEHPEIEFVFVGDGPRYERIARQRARRHLDNIRLLPYQPLNRLKDLMESGDIHLISMEDMAVGMVVPSKLYAALAVHRPCLLVGPPLSETGQVIDDFGCGSIVSQGDAAALAEEIRQLRLSSEKWFAAHKGAGNAARVFVPKDAIRAWIERANGVLPKNDGARAVFMDVPKAEGAEYER